MPHEGGLQRWRVRRWMEAQECGSGECRSEWSASDDGDEMVRIGLGAPTQCYSKPQPSSPRRCASASTAAHPSHLPPPQLVQQASHHLTAPQASRSTLPTPHPRSPRCALSCTSLRGVDWRRCLPCPPRRCGRRSVAPCAPFPAVSAAPPPWPTSGAATRRRRRRERSPLTESDAPSTVGPPLPRLCRASFCLPLPRLLPPCRRPLWCCSTRPLSRWCCTTRPAIS